MRTFCVMSLALLLSLAAGQVSAQSSVCGQLGETTRITDDPATSDAPFLIWTGTVYAAAWRDSRDGNEEVYFARFDASGQKIGDDVRVTNASGHSFVTSMVWTGNEYGIVWIDDRDGNNEIYFARLSPSGNKIGVDLRITNDSGSSRVPSLAWTGTEYGVSWDDDRSGAMEIYFVRLDSLGNEIDDEVRITNESGTSFLSRMVWTGSEFGIAWVDDRDGNREIYFARLDTMGNKIGGDVRVTNDSGDAWVPSIVWTGSGFGIAWSDSRAGGREVYFTRLDALGNEIGDDVQVTSDMTDPRGAFVTWAGSEFGISWAGDHAEGATVGFARRDDLGNELGETTFLVLPGNTPYYTYVVWNGTGYAVSWYNWVDGDYQSFFARVACGCSDFIDHSVYGRLLFPWVCTRDASSLTEDVYDNKTLGINKGPHDAFYLSSDGMSFAPLVVDDVVDCDGQDSGLGPYAPQPGVPPYLLDVPIQNNFVPLPAHEITSLIAPGLSQPPFALLDVDRSIYGHTPVYLVRDCGIHVRKGLGTMLYWHSHDVEVGGFQSDLDVVSGVISELRADRDFSRACFFGSFLDTSRATDRRPDPPLNDGYYYLVSGTCAAPLGYGNSSAGPRGDLGTAPACP